MIKLSFDKRLLNRCIKFAEDRVSGSKQLYSYRGESRNDKMIEDIIIGTLGEWAVYKYVTSLGYKSSKPDMKIYENKRKSFDCDLNVDDVKVHVKSQGLSSVKRYGHSWLLQKRDSVVNSPSDNDLFAFCSVDLDNNEFTILGFCWALDIKDSERFSECRVPYYRHSKVALYLNELEDLLVEF